MLYYKIINGQTVFFKNPLIVGDRQIFNPTEEMLLEQGWQVYVPPETPIIEPQPMTEPGLYDVMVAVKRMLSSSVTDLSDEEALSVAALYPTWASKVGEQVNVGERYWYDGKLYKVLQQHTVQDDWTPDVSVSLFTEVSIEEWPELVVPIPSTNPYMSGDKVTYNGRHYICVMDYTVWTPYGYAAAWNLVE